MKKPSRKWMALLLALLLGMPLCQIRADSTEEKEVEFYIEQEQADIRTRSLDNGTRLPVTGIRYDKFRCKDSTPSTSSCPNLGMGIKYIVTDGENPDGGGKWRYVYCLEFAKDSPTGGLEMERVGWADRKIAHALYYGAVYYGQPCRFAPYSTGDWQMDYFVTQVAIHVLNGEFDLAAVIKGMNKSTASQEEKNLAYDRICLIVANAENSGNYGGFTPEGWMDMNHCTFSLTGYRDAWYYENGKYLSAGAFSADFKSHGGYDFREQLTGYEIFAPEGVGIQKNGEQTYGDFQAVIDEQQYEKWKLTGHTVNIRVKASMPRYWGGGIYQYRPGTNYQKVCFLTWGFASGMSEFWQSVDLHIPRESQKLTIYKKDEQTGELLSGASFSLWAFDGNGYSKKAGDFHDQGDGSYLCENIEYTFAKDGKFLIREDEAPEPYDRNYIKENEADEADYEAYKGREILMDEHGFRSEKVKEPFVFLDKKLIPKADLEVLKYNIDTGENLEHAEFEVYEWNIHEGRYDTLPLQSLVYEEQNQVYRTETSLVKTEENGGKFLVKETRIPEGFHCGWSQEVLVEEPGTVTIKLEAPNYPGRKFTIYKRIRKDEITWEHGNPTFFFRIRGTDLDGEQHGYHCLVEFTREEEAQQEGEFLVGKTVVEDIPAGIYRVEELEDTNRYVLTELETDDDNVTVEKTEAGVVNGVMQIRGAAVADLIWKDGSAVFENRKIRYDEYSDTAVAVNRLG